MSHDDLGISDPAPRPVPQNRSLFQRLFGRARAPDLGTVRKPWLHRLPILVLATILLYYTLGAAWVHKIDDDIEFDSGGYAAGSSKAVTMAAALVLRELDENLWTANDPFFYPGWVLDNKPNFQQGLVYAVSRFALELSDQLGRARGSSQVDPDLDKASGLLRYPGNVWIFDLSTSMMPTASSEKQYRAAAKALESYNERLSEGNAIFDRRADNLMAALERIAADIGSSSAIIDRHVIEESGWPLHFTADDIFYATKGRLYGYYMILRELGVDFAPVIQASALDQVWAQMLESMRIAAQLQPMVVMNGGPDSQVVPSHLSAQGFFLLRARTQLKEITNVLLK